ncbi:uncharacterized protein LOC124131170 [Haliotis rufescens]|uniref:uncharacterized protein LOC124131170 n=1 Tax=Haliotis rufescens TaxID=6454 RepID=UPI00201F933D|nr:uncharacterized protein LOC124131170 [Haliotis rufescens]
MEILVSGNTCRTLTVTDIRDSTTHLRTNPVTLSCTEPTEGDNVTIVMAGPYLALCEVQVFGKKKESCHCSNGCSDFPNIACSTSPSGPVCKSPWFGSFCQKENIAFQKTARQSSTYNDTGGLYCAAHAVDGNTATNISQRSCSHTDETDTVAVKASWQVLLDGHQMFNISRIRIFLRGDQWDHNKNMTVLVNGGVCNSVSETTLQGKLRSGSNPFNVTCTQVLKGNNVTITMSGRFLTLCEVQVFVCSDGWFGSDCDKQCQCLNTTEVCDKDTGYCKSGCAARKQGQGCQDCEDGYYGGNCLQQCGSCKNGTRCNKSNGECPQGCKTNFQTPYCKDCEDGYFGGNCLQLCGSCKDSTRCNKSNGECPQGCKTNFQVPHCKDCVDGYYGGNCSQQCGSCKNGTHCNKSNGECLQGCKTNFQAPHCKDCVDGYYGGNCSQQCGSCKNGTHCNKSNGECPQGCKTNFQTPYCKDCEDGYFGGNCSQLCGSCKNGTHCNKSNGECPQGCKTNFQAPHCKDCVDGYYGGNCSQQCGSCKNGTHCNKSNGECPQGCKTNFQTPYCKDCEDGYFGGNCSQLCGSCKNGTHCNKSNGECPQGCKTNFQAPHCKDCVDGYYGGNCSQQCGSCKNGTHCNKSNGECPQGCKTNFQTPYCKDCEDGYFGGNCSQLCGSCKNGTHCNKSNGACPQGCKTNFQTPYCKVAQKSNKQGPQSLTGVIVGVVIAVLSLAAVVAVLVYMRRRRNSQKTETEDQFEESTTESSFIASSERTASPSLKPTKPVKPPKKQKPPADNVYENSDHYYNVLPAPVRLDRLMQYVREKVTGMGFEHEYKLLRHGLNGEHTEGKKPENKKRNRFLALFPYDASRVVLSPDGDATCDYIHASYVQGFHETSVFIAAQGPNNVTVDDFWRMIWQENVSQIVMLTRVMELNRKKCEQYWPDGMKEKKCGNILIKPLLSTVRADFTIRKFLVQHSNKPSDKRTVTQLHFTSWPDHDVPSAPALVGFWKQYRGLVSSEEDITGPVVVHCSAGVGRTGTFIALDNLFDEGESQNKVNVFSCVSKMREARMNMVQTVEQYRFVHESVMEALESRGTFYTLSDFEKKFGTEVKYTRQQEMEMNKQFQSLEYMKMEIPEKLASDAYLPDNISKNRNKDIVPANRVRPFLSTPVADHNDYINAVVLPSATQPLGLLATQTPLTQTVVDFWRLVYDHDCFTIVCLEDNQALYPRQNETLNIGPFRITTLQVDTSRDSFTEMQLNLALREQDNTHQQIRVFKLRSQIPGPPEPFLDFVNEVGTKGSSEEHRTLVHCADGARLCGVFCSVLNIISRLRLDKEVDIYLTIRELQCYRPQFIQSYDQYKFCYGLVKEYLRDSGVYANL